ncbi:DnaA ATPase domain-containing protein [Clostridium estertheticum]|uniref:DnaA ATPase domain-containing protein n=1 Tax=Clostridium estertheticum TaxID=238834 RepID=UPI001C7DF918|nr:DnaA/Hda family protein [Clostridium estertheticum]MBX4270163.1 AAA family ATPase [Clostridium estertheticum]WLC79669.1 AAA family ATPase [Clostridium estertheticum]
MEKMIYELILEVKKLKKSINNIEEKLEKIEKGLHVKKGVNAITVSCNGGYTGEHITVTSDSNRYNEWEKVKLVLKAQMNDVSYNTWIEPICVIKLDGAAITLAISSEFHKAIVKERYLKDIKSAILNVTGREYKIEISVVKISENKSEIYSIDTANMNKFIQCKVNSKYLFENMVVGKNNELAYKSALKVAKSPGEDMKLLYIYGEAGMGKTHLLNSINNYILENSKSIKIINITIYNFINNMINSISNDKNGLFNSEFYNADVLVFDDLQDINGKERSQEEFKNILNTVLAMGKQVVLGSTKPSREIIINGEKLESVFEVSAAFQLTRPDLNTKIKILKNMVSKEELLFIDDDTINIIAENVDTNVRELIGAYNKVVSYSKMVDKKINRQEILSII